MLIPRRDLLDAEPQQRAERFTRGGADPVRIAAAGVQHLCIALPFALGSKRNELVLELERAQLKQLLLFSPSY